MEFRLESSNVYIPFNSRNNERNLAKVFLQFMVFFCLVFTWFLETTR